MISNKTFTITSGSSKKDLSSVPEEEYDSVASDEEEYEDEGLQKSKYSSKLHITMHQPLSGKLAANQYGSEVRKPNTFRHSTGSENYFGLGTSRGSRQRRGKSTGFCDYESLCRSNLGLKPEPHVEFSPMKAHIKNKWGKSSRNWSLWSAWDSSLLQFPYFGSGNAFPKLSYEFERGQFRNTINFAFQKHHLNEKGWKQIQQNFIVLRVIKQNFGERYYPFTQEITLDAQQMVFEEDKHGQPTAYYSKSTPMKLLGCSGLADILGSIINESDVLVISGGYDALRDKENPGSLLLGLNFNKEQHTQILRLPENLYEDLTLYEKIEPLVEDKRFKFTYRVQSGRFQRVVEQHRTFDKENFCRKVTDTLAYSRARWDIPVPIVRSSNVESLYEILCSPNFKMPPLRPPTPSDDLSFFKPSSPTHDQLNSPFRTSKVYGYRGNPMRQSQNFGGVEPSSKQHKCVSVLCLIMLTVLMLVIGGVFIMVLYSDVCPASMSRKGSASGDHSPSNNPGGIGSLLLGFQTENNAPSEVIDETSNLKILEKIWERRERYYYSNDLNSNGIYRWVAVKTRTVVQWIDVAIRWIEKNCNLQCLLAKMGFNVDEILEPAF